MRHKPWDELTIEELEQYHLELSKAYHEHHLGEVVTRELTMCIIVLSNRHAQRRNNE